MDRTIELVERDCAWPDRTALMLSRCLQRYVELKFSGTQPLAAVDASLVALLQDRRG